MLLMKYIQGNPFNTKYYIDIINRKFKEDLGFEKDKVFEDVKRDIYEISADFYDPFVINTYRNLTRSIDKYKNREEGPYEIMRDNLKYYYNLYENPLSDGNINIYINGNEKKKDIKEIIHKEKKLIETRIEQLDKIIKGIKNRNNVYTFEDKLDDKNDKKEKPEEIKQNNDKDEKKDEDKSKEEL